jgi:hypothetical protein
MLRNPVCHINEIVEITDAINKTLPYHKILRTAPFFEVNNRPSNIPLIY